ncbi:MAG: RNA degradosome polyphosphate kinase, partial [Planctomycetia bacterium]
VVAPNDLHRRTLELIDEQTQRALAGRPARIFAKLNALVDHTVIEALYRASQAGVPIDIVPRGICSLRPGVPGLSETIRVRSIVDRFLEHSRIYVFGPDEEARVFLSSADWMPRNFFRRVELMFPVLAPELAARILKEIIPVYLADNTRARQLDADGVFHLLRPGPGQTPVRCQMQMLEQAAPEPDAFGTTAPAATVGEGTLLAGLGRLTPPPSAGRARGPAGKPRKTRG